MNSEKEIGKAIVWFNEIDSTNRYMSDREGLEPGTVVAAQFQTEGRGQRGNTWESKAFENLTFSIYLTPGSVKVQDQFMLSKAMALGVCDFLTSMVRGVSVKWPNDIYVANSKIAGILIENKIMGNSIESSVVGIGLNVNQTDFPDDIPNPVSLARITGKTFNVNEILEGLISNLNFRYLQLINGEYAALSADYFGALYQFGKQHRYLANGEEFEATIVGVKNSGEIVLEKSSGERVTFGFKELVYLPPKY